MQNATLRYRADARWRTNSVIIVISMVIISIILISIAGFGGTKLLAPSFGWAHGATPAEQAADLFEGRFVRWDSGYYVTIARDGYSTDGPERAFFPLYPLLSRAISAALRLPLLWTGWLISVGCFFAAAFMLYRLALIDYDPDIARWSVLWFCFFPVSFFYVSFYPEALFMLTTIASFYFARRGQFVFSGCCIALAGAARPSAFLCAIPYAVEFLLQRKFQWRSWLRFAVGGLIAPLGALGYLLFLAAQVGSTDPIGVYNDNLATHWKMSTVWPWTTFYDAMQAALFGVGIGVDWFSKAIVWHDLLYAILGFALALWSFRTLRLSLSLFLLGNMLFFSASHGPHGYVFESMARHVATIFPTYLVLAFATKLIPERVRWLPIVCSGVLLGFGSAWFASGRWIS